MAFVNEFVPDEDKSRFDPNIYFDPRTKEAIRPFRWTIDHDRNAFIILLGGGGPTFAEGDSSMPEVFAMAWGENVMKFSAIQDASGSREAGYTINWRVLDIEMPKGLEDQRNDWCSLLVEGLDAMGTSVSDRPSNVITVNVCFLGRES